MRQELLHPSSSASPTVFAIDGLRAALDAITLAVLVLDDAGHVLYANRSATRLCASAGWLPVRHAPDKPMKFLPFASLLRGQRCPYWGFVDAPSAAAADQHATSILVQAREHRLANGRSVYILYMSSLALNAPESLKMFSEMHGLSKTEHRILCKIYTGLTSSEIAFVEKMSVHTVRAHTKAILKKAGVHRQSVLIRQIEAFSQVNVPAQPSAATALGARQLARAASKPSQGLTAT